MQDLEHARGLLGLAAEELKALGGMVDSGTFAEQIFGFHAQQVAEKALKAWIAAMGIEYPYTHDISALLRVLEDSGAMIEHLRDLAEYNPFAVQFRYDAFDWSGEALDRTAVLVRLRSLVEEIQRLVAVARR